MLWRAQAILKHASGLARDNVTNTFWFSDSSAPTAAIAEAVAERVRDFYVIDSGAGQAQPVMNYLNNSLAAVGHEVKVSPIVEATGEDTRGIGFPPMWTEVFDFVGWTAPITGLPNEVALCLSFKNTASGSVPPGQRRGRIYVGPMAANAMAASASAWRPTNQVQTDVLAAADALRDAASTAAKPWIIYSRPYPGRGVVSRPGHPNGDLPALPARSGVAYSISEFWTDNAFDTQRRRGERATLRQTA